MNRGAPVEFRPAQLKRERAELAARAAELYAEGNAGRAIAVELGITESRVYGLLRTAGVERRPRGAPPGNRNGSKPAPRAQIRALRRLGLGYKAIARALDMERDQVRGYVKRIERDGELELPPDAAVIAAVAAVATRQDRTRTPGEPSTSPPLEESV